MSTSKTCFSLEHERVGLARLYSAAGRTPGGYLDGPRDASLPARARPGHRSMRPATDCLCADRSRYNTCDSCCYAFGGHTRRQPALHIAPACTGWQPINKSRQENLVEHEALVDKASVVFGVRKRAARSTRGAEHARTNPAVPRDVGLRACLPSQELQLQI